MWPILRIVCRVHYLKQQKFTHFFTFNSPYKTITNAIPLKSKVSIKIYRYIKYQRYDFHTTPRRDIPPLLALLLRPLVRIGAVIFGRFLRKWWKRKSNDEQFQYIQKYAGKKNVFFGTLGFFVISIFLYYITHIEKDPITNRSRFIMFNKQQRIQLSELIFEVHLEQHKKLIISAKHPVYIKLQKITEILISANKDLPVVSEKKWSLSVIDSPLKNAYVLPGGNIFVFLGMMQMVENDDQLAVILAHEMAHALLHHSFEQMSTGILIDLLVMIPIMALWAMFPDVLATIFHAITQHVVDIVHNLPYSRALESEADEIGLKLAAKACVDVREAVVFWGMMRTLTEMNVEPNQVPWLSTHPDHADREQNLNAQMANALKLRDPYQCGLLSPVDPRKTFYERTTRDHLERFKQRGIIT
ncbi:metalloendopeptidase OMA1, mitochondrial [Orussus abietinus]|uniref:metalloendopeptidase OMA1, mitochondrial n=1 Tax=Orussus abietinus TaxID=222816 RepID=UPI000626BBA6|nr:metalloendopeptidase OMA1, mitochondrial [Orussus abietinus]XP_012277472.1 metalloendopeptidase OMA1, mitochondrial [Orussus abietinus]